MQSERAGKSSVVEQKGPEGGGAYLSMVLEQIKGKLVVSCQALPCDSFLSLSLKMAPVSQSDRSE